MATEYGVESIMLAAGVSLVTVAETTVLLTNAVRTPFTNCKNVIIANVQVLTGAGTTGLQVRVRRNPSQENLVVNAAAFTQLIGAAVNGSFSVMCTDQVPDGRDCVYALTVQQVGAGGNGTVQPGTTMQASVYSG